MSWVRVRTAWSLATTFALLTFPAEDVPLRFRRRLLRQSAGLLGVLLVGYALASGPLDGAPDLTNPLGVEALAPWARPVGDGASFALLAVTVVALALLVLAWRRSRGTARARLTWLALGAFVALLAGATGALLLTGGGPAWIGSLAEAAVVATLPTVTGIAVLRTGLLDVTVVLNRTIVYAVLTGLVLATYFATLALVTGLLGEGAGRGASLLASALVAVFLVPVKDRVQRLVERSLYGDRAEPYRVLADLAARLERTSAVDDLITTVTDTVQRTLVGGRARWWSVDARDRASSRPASCSCWRTWRARSRARSGWPGSPTTSSSHGNGWSGPGRRSASGCGATCTTGSARPSPPRPCRSTSCGTGGRTTIPAWASSSTRSRPASSAPSTTCARRPWTSSASPGCCVSTRPRCRTPGCPSLSTPRPRLR